MSAIVRQHEFNLSYPADVAGNLNAVPEINTRGMAGLRVYIPAGSSITSVTVYDAPCTAAENSGTSYNNGNFLAANNGAGGTAISQTVAAGKSFDLDPAIFPAGAIKLITNTPGNIGYSSKG